MIDASVRRDNEEKKERVRHRINTKIDSANYEFFPAKKPVDFYDTEIEQRVAVYARVSTDNVQQTSSYELQKKYYEDFVVHHPNWTLVKIYADEGISGTSLAHRDEFNRMITDCRNGQIDMIITKSVSRFARNVVDCISMVRMLADLSSPVGVFFESECIFSLKDDSQMALSFQATMAQEESHIRSRSMETSLRMRLDGGLPLTPKLLGYSHDSDGNLVVNPEEAPTVAIRPCLPGERDACAWCCGNPGKRKPKQITCKMFFAKVFTMMGWNLDYRYKLLGRVIHSKDEWLIAFDLTATEVYQRVRKDGGKPKASRMPVFPEGWKTQFGLPFREHQKSMQVNIFDGYAVYGLRDNAATAAVSDDSTAPKPDTGTESNPIKEDADYEHRAQITSRTDY